MFSQRQGIVQEPVLQIDSVSQTLLNRLRNLSKDLSLQSFSYFSASKGRREMDDSIKSRLAMDFGIDIDVLPKSGFSNSLVSLITFIKNKFFVTDPYFLVYDFCEFLLKIDKTGYKSTYIGYYNDILELENSAYRLTQEGIFIPITDEVELQSLNEVTCSPYTSVNTHINTAIMYFRNTESSDYRNVVKECISAVESMAMIIDPKAKTLGDALNTIKTLGYDLHPALIEGFKKLYGFTNDAGGIRHALTEDQDLTVDFDFAKYMLVSCSAFVNLLISVYEPRKIK